MNSRKLYLFLGVVVALALISGLGLNMTNSANGADGSTGTILAGNDFYYENTGITLKLTGLTGGSDYAMNITAGVFADADTNNQVTFTTGASETSKRITLDNCQKPTSGNKAVIILIQASAGTEIDRAEIFCRDPASGLPTGFFIALGIAVMIFYLLLRIIKGMQ